MFLRFTRRMHAPRFDAIEVVTIAVGAVLILVIASVF